jgi:hypothetical protein
MAGAMNDTSILEPEIVERGGWLADYQRTRASGVTATETFQGVLADEIVLPQSAVDSADPAAMVNATLSFADTMQNQAFYLPGEYAQEAAWCFYVNDYLTQATQGGHVQYFANRGEDELALRCCAFGLKSMIADPHLELFNLFVQLQTSEPKAAKKAALKAGYRSAVEAARDLDRKFAAIEQEEPLLPRQKIWLKSLRKLRVVPDGDWQQNLAQLANSNPLRQQRRQEADRIRAEHGSTDPAFLNVKALCEQAGLGFRDLRATGFAPMRTVWPEGPKRHAYGFRAETDAGARMALFYAEGMFAKRYLAVLMEQGGALPLGSLSLARAEFDQIVPAQRT